MLRRLVEVLATLSLVNAAELRELTATVGRFEDRLDSHVRRFLRMLILFAVSLVDREEWFYILVGSFSYVRRAFFCILFLLEQNQVVDLVVVKHCPDSI